MIIKHCLSVYSVTISAKPIVLKGMPKECDSAVATFTYLLQGVQIPLETILLNLTLLPT
jgi:hypothetical protein